MTTNANPGIANEANTERKACGAARFQGPEGRKMEAYSRDKREIGRGVDMGRKSVREDKGAYQLRREELGLSRERAAMHGEQSHDAAAARLRADIAAYEPFNEQEAADKRVILRALDTGPGVFDRSAQAHMACSIWVVDPAVARTLLVYHNIYDSWSWIGGHADGEPDLRAVALRELREETGVSGARIVPCGPGGIFSLEVLTVDGHEKRGEYVSSHLHLNVTYLAVADPEEPVRAKPDENSGVRWAPLEDAVALSTEPWIRERVYRKLIDKLARLPVPLS